MFQSQFSPPLCKTPGGRVCVLASGGSSASLIRFALALSTLIVLGSKSLATDAQDPEVREAIDRAAAFLRDNVGAVAPHEAGLVAYALIRSGETPDSPAVKTLIRRVLDVKFKGHYGDTPHQYYEAGTDMMMFEAANPKRYTGELETIAAFTVEHQWPSGSWYYPNQPEMGGDTSHTQYAVLGLWAASRAGVKIPAGVWSRIADWHLNNQVSDGGFAYHPGGMRTSTHSMTANGVASLCIARLMLYPNRTYPSPFGPAGEDDEPRKSDEKANKLSGRDEAKPPESAHPAVLDPVDLSRNRADGGRSRRSQRITSALSGKVVSLSRINKGISDGANWLRINFTKSDAHFHNYYLYGLERACALAGIDEFDGHEWFSTHAGPLIRRQRADGHFDGPCNTFPETSFAVLFLSRATAKLVGRGKPEERFGGGLMIGGRGLPSNLAAIQASGDGIKVRKIDAPVDKLLSELENPKSVSVESVQQAIVETVQVGDREKLVGQKDRLRKLAKDPRPEVRRTALWALGRCATIHDASVLVKALDDPDLNVVIEANNALCWLSRRPNGFGRPADPTANLPENTSERQQRDAALAWRAQVRNDWREWFKQVGPYSERDLPIDLPP